MHVRYNETIPVRPETLHALETRAADAAALLKADLESASAKIVSLLRDYEKLKDNAGRIFSFRVLGQPDMDEAGSGFVEIAFPVQLYYCRDVNEWTEEKMVLAIQVDFANSSALISGEDAFIKDGKEF